MNLSEIAYNAKDRLLEKVDAWIEEMEMSHKVCDQQNAMAGRDTREKIEGLNRVEAYKLEKAIMEKEDYDPSKDKWGFGPVVISPVNYSAFM